MNNSFIQINNISKHFADVKAVDDVSFEIKEGEFFSPVSYTHLRAHET